jgi:hypothetical protein
MMAVSDTTPRAAAIQLQLYRSAGPSRRAQIAVELSDAVRETALAGIRRRHPDYTDEQVKSAFLRLVYDLVSEFERQGRLRKVASSIGSCRSNNSGQRHVSGQADFAVSAKS